jgi:hypothetical protein
MTSVSTGSEYPLRRAMSRSRAGVIVASRWTWSSIFGYKARRDATYAPSRNGMTAADSAGTSLMS